MSTSMRKTGPEEQVRVRDILSNHEGRQIPLVRRDTPIAELAQAIQWYRHSRQLYVVDEENRLLGNITLGRLVMYVFARSHGSGMNPRHIMGLITCETAGDLMTGGTLSAGLDDRVEDVLERMVAGHVEEIPVLDEQGAVVADLTMIDLLMEERKKLEVGN